MVQKAQSDNGCQPSPPPRLFYPVEKPLASSPLKPESTDKARLIANRPLVLDTVDVVPAYSLKPEVLVPLKAGKRQVFNRAFSCNGRESRDAVLERGGFLLNVCLRPKAAIS